MEPLRRRAALLALLLTLTAPVASAAAGEVVLRAGEPRWNGESVTRLDAPADEVLVWVPAAARIQAVEAEGGRAASWRAAEGDAVLVRLQGNETAARVAFDVPAPPLSAFRLVAPQDYASLALVVEAAPGEVVASREAAFAEDAGAFRATLAPVRRGDAVTLRVVPADRVGELPVLVTVGAASLLVLALGIVWHKVRPPLAGRPAQRFLDHLGELQARLLPPAVAFALLNLFYFTSGLRAVEVRGVPLVAPTFGTRGSLAARTFEAIAERLVPPGVELVAIRPVESVLVQVQMALFLAAVTVLPLLLYEVAAFLGPALEAKERRAAGVALPVVGGLFLAGALFGYLAMAPLLIRTLLAYAPGIGARPLLAAADLVSFALLLVLAFALAFQLPVVMHLVSRIGLVPARAFRKYFRHAVVVIVLVAGIVTPDPTVVSQLFVAVPVTGLYVLGIGAATLGERKRAARRGINYDANTRTP